MTWAVRTSEPIAPVWQNRTFSFTFPCRNQYTAEHNVPRQETVMGEIDDREPYDAPAKPTLVGSVEAADITYGGSGLDFSIYASIT